MKTVKTCTFISTFKFIFIIYSVKSARFVNSYRLLLQYKSSEYVSGDWLFCMDMGDLILSLQCFVLCIHVVLRFFFVMNILRFVSLMSQCFVCHSVSLNYSFQNACTEKRLTIYQEKTNKIENANNCTYTMFPMIHFETSQARRSCFSFESFTDCVTISINITI